VALSRAIKCAFHSFSIPINRPCPLGSIRTFGRCWSQGIQMFHDRKWCRGRNCIFNHPPSLVIIRVGIPMCFRKRFATGHVYAQGMKFARSCPLG
jgi:hypothetical protein